MTNEEAKEFLLNLSYLFGTTSVEYLNEMDGKKMRDAIKALEQEPCEDCVNRHAVEEMIKAELPDRGLWEIYGDKENETVCEICIDLMQKLSELPSVTPQQNTGKWVKYGVPRCGEQHYQCTSCGYYINFGQWEEVYTKQFKYCPNCGARMEG